MKRRARRVTLAAAVLGAGVVGVLVVTHWNTVRDHLEAWHFQLTRETGMLTGEDFPMDADTPAEHSLWFLASLGGLPVVYDRASLENNSVNLEWNGVSVDQGISAFRKIGYRIVKQHFPGWALVVVGYPAVGRRESPSRLRGGGSTTLEVKANPR